MTVTNAETAAPAPEEHEYPLGLVPPTRRGRSERLIGDVIVDLGFARRETVEEVVIRAREQGRPTGQLLIESGALRHDQLARVLAERFGVDYVDLSVFEIDMGAVKLVDVEIARSYQAVPVGFLPNGGLLVAMADPTNVLTLDEIAMITGRKVRPAAAAAEDLAALFGRLTTRLDDSLVEVTEDEPELERAPLVGPRRRRADRQARALADRAGRRAGRLGRPLRPGARRDARAVPDRRRAHAGHHDRALDGPARVSRIKIMAGMDISERRASQDGRLGIVIGAAGSMCVS